MSGARNTDPQTSHDAAKSVEDEKLKQGIAEVLFQYPLGLTAEQVWDGMPPKTNQQSVTPRFNTMAEKGTVVRTEKKRANRSRRKATIWKHPDHSTPEEIAYSLERAEAMRKGKQHTKVDRTQPLNPTSLDLNILRNEPPLLELTSFGDWFIVSLDGQEIAHGHTVSVKHLLDALGIAYKSTQGRNEDETPEEYEARVLEPYRTTVVAL